MSPEKRKPSCNRRWSYRLARLDASIANDESRFSVDWIELLYLPLRESQFDGERNKYDSCDLIHVDLNRWPAP
jgi:hypothetical protein